MFAGHVGVALAIGRFERRINVGVFVASALVLDFALWSFILLGWEEVSIPRDFARTHQADFVFPYSHGLLSAALWSVLIALVTLPLSLRLGSARFRAAFLVAAAVFSHWLLDALVHKSEMPVFDTMSPLLGLSLWNNMPVALVVETVLVVLGASMFLSGSRLPRARLVALAALSVLILALTVAGMTVAPAPPSAAAMAASSLPTLLVLCLLVGWLGSIRRGGVS